MMGGEFKKQKSDSVECCFPNSPTEIKYTDLWDVLQFTEKFNLFFEDAYE